MERRDRGNPAINIEDVQFSYSRRNVALRSVSLRIESGEFVGIIGPNGAGKTTLLTIINGIGKPSSGQVSVLGNPVTSGNIRSLRKKVGYVAQIENLDPRMPLSVREVVMIGRYGVLGLLRKPGKHDWEIVDEMMALVGMAHLARRPIGHLSGGEQQRAAIARCLAQEPELFLLDEPTDSLDWKAQTEILELVKRIHDERHLTTLFVTHDLNALPLACERVVLMKDGQIKGVGPTRELLTDENLSQLYDMPVSAIEKRRREPVSV